MIEVVIWLTIGILSGWIGYLASRSNGQRRIACFLIIGMTGSLFGGLLAERIGLPEAVGTIDAISSLTALFTSELVVVIYSVVAALLE